MSSIENLCVPNVKNEEVAATTLWQLSSLLGMINKS